MALQTSPLIDGSTIIEQILRFEEQNEMISISFFNDKERINFSKELIEDLNLKIEKRLIHSENSLISLYIDGACKETIRKVAKS
jgi:hypothetical protein